MERKKERKKVVKKIEKWRKKAKIEKKEEERVAQRENLYTQTDFQSDIADVDLLEESEK